MCESEFDEEELSVGDMVYHDLLHYDLKLAALDTAYCAYQASELDERPEFLYELMADFKMNEITLEAVLQHGDKELSDLHVFLPKWITCLGVKGERSADRLILEAADLLNDSSAVAGYAQKYADVHPGLYLKLLEKRTEGIMEANRRNY